MLLSLLTPLRARFEFPVSRENSQTTETSDDAQKPEDFAKEVLVELMRTAVENLREANSLKMKVEVLATMQQIMQQGEHTKDVFRDLDGFLILLSVLSSIDLRSVDVVESQQESKESRDEMLAAVRNVFKTLSDAMYDHEANSAFFRVNVGYDHLTLALRNLLSRNVNDGIVDEIMGLLLSFAFHDFSLTPIFASLRGLDEDSLYSTLEKLETQLCTIRRPEAIWIIWKMLPQFDSCDHSLRHGTMKLFEIISRASHRNLAVLANLGLVKSVFARFLESRADESFSEKERHLTQKLLRRLLEIGATTTEIRTILQRAIKEDTTLDSEVLDVIRLAMKASWFEHFSMESPGAMKVTDSNARGMPVNGLTFMTWIWLPDLPSASHCIFSIDFPLQRMLSLRLRSDGKLELETVSSSGTLIFSKSTLRKKKWTHIALVHHPHRVSNPTVRLFIDGIINDGVNWPYSKPLSTPLKACYTVGDASVAKQFNWCMTTVYMLGMPLSEEHIRLFHRLGPRYSGDFQDPDILKSLTYTGSTALNIHLTTVAFKNPASAELSAISKVIKNGFCIPESQKIFSISPAQYQLFNQDPESRTHLSDKSFTATGGVFPVKATSLDRAIWKMGGAAITLRLVQLANGPHELSRTLGILADALKNSWQNSEDMERLRGYEILAGLLREKARMINLTAFETLFEFLGINFRKPEQSTIVNVAAYRAIALDFELWSRAREEIQTVFFQHFFTLFETSRYKSFNIRRRLSKLGLVRRFLFVYQIGWYGRDISPLFLGALKCVCNARFSKDDDIRPIISYLAANLHNGTDGISSPRSAILPIESSNSREKAEEVLEILVSTLAVPEQYKRFSEALPLNRIMLLLLGEHPSPFIAARILSVLKSSTHTNPSFIHKFEISHGWSILKLVLPGCWDKEVHRIVFEILVNRTEEANGKKPQTKAIVCPQILPAIMSTLQCHLKSVSNNYLSDTSTYVTYDSLEVIIEKLIEELMELHSSTASFRHLFKSHSLTQSFVDGYRSFVSKSFASPDSDQWTVRTLEKLMHFGLALALDNAVSSGQKKEIVDIIKVGESVLNPANSRAEIDPGLVADSERRNLIEVIQASKLTVKVEEKATLKTMSRMEEWRKTVITSERKRLRKNVLDLQEHQRQVSRLQDWKYLLTYERGLWASHGETLWCLDETEGPHRIRKKLEPQLDVNFESRVNEQKQSVREHIHIQEATEVSPLQLSSVPPWSDIYEASTTDFGERELADDVVDDKLRRIRHELEPGDVIEAVATVARIVYVDSSPGLLIFGRSHIYMLEGVVQNDDGEVIDVRDAPKKLLFVPGSVVELDGPQKALRWARDDICTFSDKKFLFRDVGLEIHFKDSRSLLVVFMEKKRRAEFHHRLADIISNQNPSLFNSPGSLKSASLGRVSAKMRSAFRLDNLVDDLQLATRKWQAREISNFTYLSLLNQYSGRTPSDATQYPVYPWVLQDYTSQTLDLTNPESYRDLSKPMGALTPARAESAQMKYENLGSVGEEPFHYGTHFSSSMVVCHFLIRLAPFTNMFKTLQGGNYDLPDRLFNDISRSYEMAAHDVRGDVRELIPEFFTCPEFLENSANHDFGVQQLTGERIHDVKLPAWARKDPLLFIVMNRRALESPYVSEKLPAWIDLIWGCKQRDEASLNVFHPLSYEGSIDLEKIESDLERDASVGIIHNFGQTPKKLFNTPHPERFTQGSHSLPIGEPYGIEEDPHLLLQGSRCIKDLKNSTPVCELVPDLIGETIIPCPKGLLCLPIYVNERVVWREGSSDLRVTVDGKVVQFVENAYCNCAAFADSTNLVTGSSDYTVRLWKVKRGSSSTNASTQISLSHIMRVHTDEVICVAASRAWSLVLSGSKDGSAAIWDLNRGIYVRSIWHGVPGESDELGAVNLVAINESTGYLATCSKSKLCLHTINARPMATLDLTTLSSFSKMIPAITSLAFHERDYSPLGVLATGGSDGTITLRTWTADGTPEGEKAQWEFLTMRTMKVRKAEIGNGITRYPAITALKFSGESLYHGEDTGKTYKWSLAE